MTYILLHNPVLWRLFPDQMEAAARKFMSLKPSDIQIKRDLVPLGDFGHLAQQWRF
jgi:hypothetical protein